MLKSMNIAISMERSRQAQILDLDRYFEEQRREPRTELLHSPNVSLVINREDGTVQTLHADLLDLSEGGASMALAGSTELARGEQGRVILELHNGRAQAIPFEVRWVEKNPEILCMGVDFRGVDLN